METKMKSEMETEIEVSEKMAAFAGMESAVKSEVETDTGVAGDVDLRDAMEKEMPAVKSEGETDTGVAETWPTVGSECYGAVEPDIKPEVKIEIDVAEDPSLHWGMMAEQTTHDVMEKKETVEPDIKTEVKIEIDVAEDPSLYWGIKAEQNTHEMTSTDAPWNEINNVKNEVTLETLKFDPRDPGDREVDKERFAELCRTLKSSNPTLGFCRYAKPPAPLAEPETQDCASEALPDPPASLQDIRRACRRKKQSMQLSVEDANILEQATRGHERFSPAWHESRRHRLTASNFHKVINMRSGTSPAMFLKEQLYAPTRHLTKAMELDQEREERAAQRYVLQKKVEGEMLTLSEAGLRVRVDKGFIGASTGRVARDPTGRVHLVEIKNPLNTWDCGGVTGIQAKLKCFVKDDTLEKGVTLNKKHAYYTQVQGQLYVYDADYCDLVLCTKSLMFIERISRNDGFIASMVQKLEEFYDNVFLPEIVSPKVKHGKEPMDLRKQWDRNTLGF